MKNTELVSIIENWYNNSIYPKCPKYIECKKDCDNFSKRPKMCYIGRKYNEYDQIPNLVFLSLDSGSEVNYTIEEIRNGVEKDPPQSFEKNKHWYQTFDIAKLILSPFLDESVKKTNNFVNPFIVHTNSAKCTQNKTNNSEADKIFKERDRLLCGVYSYFSWEI